MLKRKNTYSVICVFMAVLMIVLSVVSPVGALSETLTTEEATLKPSVNPEDKIDSALKEKMAEASPDEKIPVAIWYEDIDQEQVDTLTTQKVGFSQEEVALDYEMPSTALLNDLKAEKDGADAELEAYMERTKLQRESERKRTDEYIMTRREFSRAKYNEKSASIIDNIAINEDNITFKSQYAPMIIAEISVSEIEALQNSDVVAGLYYDANESDYVELYEVSSDSGSDTESNESPIDMIKQVVGYTELVTTLRKNNASYMPGENVKIGVVERGGLVDVSDEELIGADIEFVGDVEYDSDQPEHMTGTVNVLVGETDGFLSGAEIFCSNTSYSSMEQLITEGVQLINVSDYISHINWVEHIVSQHSVTIVAAVGNNNRDGEVPRGFLYKPASGYNVIGVGAYYLSNDKNVTIDKSDDRVATTSSYNEDAYGGGPEKPDVIMPYIPPYGGTSYATPILTSFIAMMYQLKPSLAVYPQAVKAIVLASCHRKVNPSEDNEAVETMEQGITERQGAGAPDVFVMASIVSQGTYGTGRLSPNATQGIRRFVIPSGNTSNDPTNLNVSIAWLREIVVDNGFDHTSGAYLIADDGVDLDLYVYRNNQLVGSSKIGNSDINDYRISSTEMAYMQLNPSQWNYEIRIKKLSTYYDKVVRYGYAYSTDESYIAPMTEEGVYYIRNYYTDKYLTLDTTTNETTMQDFATTETDRKNQMWVVRESGSGYNIAPAYGTEGTNLNFGDQVGTNEYYKAVVGTRDIGFTMSSWETDTTLEPDAHIFTFTKEGRSNILSYTYSTGIFVRSTTEPVVNMYRMWVLEDINYRPGDINCNGMIDDEDAQLIRNYVNESGEYNNMQSVLVDFNCDGVKNIKDVTEIQKYLED